MMTRPRRLVPLLLPGGRPPIGAEVLDMQAAAVDVYGLKSDRVLQPGDYPRNWGGGGRLQGGPPPPEFRG